MKPVRLSFVFTILNQNEFRIATVAVFTCDLYTGSPPPHDLERLRTTITVCLLGNLFLEDTWCLRDGKMLSLYNITIFCGLVGL